MLPQHRCVKQWKSIYNIIISCIKEYISINKCFNITILLPKHVSGFEHRFYRHVDLETGSSRSMKTRQYYTTVFSVVVKRLPYYLRSVYYFDDRPTYLKVCKLCFTNNRKYYLKTGYYIISFSLDKFGFLLKKFFNIYLFKFIVLLLIYEAQLDMWSLPK